MKLKEHFTIRPIGDKYYLIPDERASLHRNIGLPSNVSALFIVNCLREDTSEEAIVDAMTKKYRAPREKFESAVSEMITTLRIANALDE